MRQFVRAAGNHTTCGVGVGTEQLLIQDEEAQAGNVISGPKSLYPCRKLVAVLTLEGRVWFWETVATTAIETGQTR